MPPSFIGETHASVSSFTLSRLIWFSALKFDAEVSCRSISQSPGGGFFIISSVTAT